MRVGNVQRRLVEVFYIEFEQNMCNGLWNTWKYPIMALSKSSLIMDQWSLNSNFPTSTHTENDEKLSNGSDTGTFYIAREDRQTDICEVHIRRSILPSHVCSEHENLSWDLKSRCRDFHGLILSQCTWIRLASCMVKLSPCFIHYAPRHEYLWRSRSINPLTLTPALNSQW
jgi:hypothetical protein